MCVPWSVGALELQGVGGDVDEAVEGSEQALLITLVEVAQARHVDGDDTHGAGLLGGAEQAVAALEQSSKDRKSVV